MNFDELILDAAKSIAAATAALIKAASEAQRELVSQGKIQKTAHLNSEDGQWSEGLVSAARLVAAATHNLCEAANALVKGHSSEEKLIGAAKQVAGSTAQLLLACKVKADPDSASMNRLESASNAVRKATDNLVKAAQQALDREDENGGNVDLNKSAVNSVVEVQWKNFCFYNCVVYIRITYFAGDQRPKRSPPDGARAGAGKGQAGEAPPEEVPDRLGDRAIWVSDRCHGEASSLSSFLLNHCVKVGTHAQREILLVSMSIRVRERQFWYTPRKRRRVTMSFSEWVGNHVSSG